VMVLILFNNHLLVEFGSGAADAKLIKELWIGICGCGRNKI
jgi:hypothetical protein